MLMGRLLGWGTASPPKTPAHPPPDPALTESLCLPATPLAGSPTQSRVPTPLPLPAVSLSRNETDILTKNNMNNNRLDLSLDLHQVQITRLVDRGYLH